MKRKYRLAVLDFAPCNYRLPLFEKLAKNQKINLFVYFCSNNGVKGGSYDPETGEEFFWENIVKGFEYKFLNEINSGKILRIKGYFEIIKDILLKRYEAIIIYSYSSFTHKIAIIISWISRTPVIFRDEIHEVRGGLFKKNIKKIIYKFLFKIPKAFLYSYSKNRKFYEKFGVKNEKLFFHPCAVDNEFFKNEANKFKNSKDKIKKEIGIEKDSKVILFVGRISPRKRVFDILKSYGKINGVKNKTLLFIGPAGNEKERLERYTLKKNIKNVIFLGFKKTSEISKFYSIADLFVVASEYDPSPKVLNEAMNFSLPVIVSDKAGTARDLVKNEKNGFIFKCGDIKTFSKYMEKMISEEKLRKEMGKESLEIVSKWNFDNDVKATIKALDYIYKK